ncbi:MAG: MaoC family dehydratase N-terminal domain-containing protein [Clostridia bacterium]|nr:MaoC family dehydratase N-terminal domain-containing protein [Clostridia bacterium]
MTREMIARYAEASGDRNPIHLDDAFARKVGLPGVIAHGLLTLAFASEWIASWAGGGERLRGISARFSEPVLPGDTVVLRGRVAGAEETGEGLRYDVRFEAVTQRGARVLSRGRATVEVPSRRG